MAVCGVRIGLWSRSGERPAPSAIRPPLPTRGCNRHFLDSLPHALPLPICGRPLLCFLAQSLTGLGARLFPAVAIRQRAQGDHQVDELRHPVRTCSLRQGHLARLLLRLLTTLQPPACLTRPVEMPATRLEAHRSRSGAQTYAGLPHVVVQLPPPLRQGVTLDYGRWVAPRPWATSPILPTTNVANVSALSRGLSRRRGLASLRERARR